MITRGDALDKPMSRKPLLEWRCVIPEALYEWEKQAPPSQARNPAHGAKHTLYGACIESQEEQALPVFTILTGGCAGHRLIHTDPVIFFRIRGGVAQADADVRDIMEHSRSR